MKAKSEHEKFLETMQTCKVCNGCNHLNFKGRTCRFDKENPVALNTAETESGYIYFIKPESCKF